MAVLVFKKFREKVFGNEMKGAKAVFVTTYYGPQDIHIFRNGAFYLHERKDGVIVVHK